jgi:hypothetical protein
MPAVTIYLLVLIYSGGNSLAPQFPKDECYRMAREMNEDMNAEGHRAQCVEVTFPEVSK